jgi:hypothetical protein
VRHADELAGLRAVDTDPRPPGRQLRLRAALRFTVGDPTPKRVVAVPELDGEDGMVLACQGFNVIATANTRGRGINEMSAALKRRLNFETVFPIPDLDTELVLVETESTALLRESGVERAPDRDVLKDPTGTMLERNCGATRGGVPDDAR